jgi:predicted acylesterase/phospholipase RssA
MVREQKYAGEGRLERASRGSANPFARDSSYLPGEVEGNLSAKPEPGPLSLRMASSDRPLPREADHKLLESERAHIKNWLEKTGNTSEKNLTGLALSGGGIRSATFSLGVLQALSRHGILKYIDFLSTVSGGGYIGAGLTWWLAGKTGSTDIFGLDVNSFPYGTEDPRHPAKSPTPILAHLKDNASYLVPGGGISYLSGVAILIRAVLLNLLVWIPIATALFVLLLVLGKEVGLPILNPFAGLFTTPEAPRNGFTQISYDLFYLLNWLGLGAIALFTVACVDFAFFTRLTRYLDDSNKGRQDRTAGREFSDNYVHGRLIRWGIVAVIAVGAGATVYLLRDIISHWVEVKGLGHFLVSIILTFGVAISALLISWIVRRIWRVENLGFVYGMRRFFEHLYGKILLIGLLLLTIGSIPLFVTTIGSKAAVNAYGAAGVILGVASGVWGHLRSVSEKLGRLGPGVVLPVGSVLLFFGVALLSYQFAIYWLQADGWLKVGLTAIFLIAVSSGFLTDINEISPHHFYRDRLMEAFLPDIERVKNDAPGSAKRAERFPLSGAWNAQDPKGPYPIINTNVVLVNSGTLKYRLRGGDSFALTPLYCGSNATGWTSTKTFAGGTLTLATAMAISGAAANPNTGVGGKGLTRNRFVSAVMTLLNLRLGFWVRRPSRSWVVASRPNHFHPGLTFSIPGYGYKEGRNFLELSDGGHFENLGIYELVRRGCRLIIVCDGGQDIRASYSDFVSAIRRIEQDFGAEIEFNQYGGPERMIARPVSNEYPKDAEYADHGFLWATIKYHRQAIRGGPTEGVIIYLKTAMIKELGIKAKGYKGAEPDFPDQSTSDQFFDEEQFEAYREVGYRIADTMLRDKALDIRGVIRKIKSPTK